MEITYYGHACFEICLRSKKRLLFDPFISPNPIAKGINISQIRPDYVLLSHGHEDHVADVETILQQSGATLVAIYEVAQYFERKGAQKIHPMNLGGQFDFGDFVLKCTISHHSSSMPDGSYGGQPAGFVVSADQKAVYYAGDTALSYDMQLLGEEFALDLSILPLGDNFTMGISDAVRASQLLKCKKVMGVHYDTFKTIRLNRAEARLAFKQEKLQLLLPNVGECVQL